MNLSAGRLRQPLIPDLLSDRYCGILRAPRSPKELPAIVGALEASGPREGQRIEGHAANQWDGWGCVSSIIHSVLCKAGDCAEG
jgi:hypothetical protein